MSAPPTLTVRPTLPRAVGERLRAICHERGMTASEFVQMCVESFDAVAEWLPNLRRSVVELLAKLDAAQPPDAEPVARAGKELN